MSLIIVRRLRVQSERGKNSKSDARSLQRQSFHDRSPELRATTIRRLAARPGRSPNDGKFNKKQFIKDFLYTFKKKERL